MALALFEPPETEFIGLAFAIVILIFAFGSVLAMGLPIAVAVGGVAAGMALISILSNVVIVPDFTTFLGIMIGLGVGIDYALFIVTRYREGLHAGHSPRQATVDAMGTAGRAVILAGVTVVVSLLGLGLIGIGWMTGMGIGVAATVLATMITSITLLPALLGFAGTRVELTRWRGLIAAGFIAVALLGIGLGIGALAAAGAGLAALTLLVSFAARPLRREVPRRPPKPVRDTLSYRWSRTIQRRPLLWVVAGASLLLVLAAPVFGMRLGFSDEGNYADDSYTRQAYDLLAEGFGAGFNGPFMITVVPGDGDSVTAVDTLHRALAETPGVASGRHPRSRTVRRHPTPTSSRRSRRRRLRTKRPADSSRHCVSTSSRQPPRVRRSTSRSPGRPRPTSTSPTSSPAAPSPSSAPCWRCRSYCSWWCSAPSSCRSRPSS